MIGDDKGSLDPEAKALETPPMKTCPLFTRHRLPMGNKIQKDIYSTPMFKTLFKTYSAAEVFLCPARSTVTQTQHGVLKAHQHHVSVSTSSSSRMESTSQTQTRFLPRSPKLRTQHQVTSQDCDWTPVSSRSFRSAAPTVCAVIHSEVMLFKVVLGLNSSVCRFRWGRDRQCPNGEETVPKWRRDRQCPNGEETDSAQMEKRQTVPKWRRDRQYPNGEETDNAQMEKRQTVPKWRRDRRCPNGEETDGAQMEKRQTVPKWRRDRQCPNGEETEGIHGTPASKQIWTLTTCDFLNTTTVESIITSQLDYLNSLLCDWTLYSLVLLYFITHKAARGLFSYNRPIQFTSLLHNMGILDLKESTERKENKDVMKMEQWTIGETEGDQEKDMEKVGMLHLSISKMFNLTSMRQCEADQDIPQAQAERYKSRMISPISAPLSATTRSPAYWKAMVKDGEVATGEADDKQQFEKPYRDAMLCESEHSFKHTEFKSLDVFSEKTSRNQMEGLAG
ncbi:hypothetical protein STEG23_026874 [Scotinomys teguina]